ncbi:MAG TPA: nicotinate phosphoribosyltransferase [Methanosarcinales archaeon]|nr:nicotinate phosphoribosyltransferase [Methanosarcinales archaeon]
MQEFLIVSNEDIKKGNATDVYFLRTEKVLREKGINPQVVAEVTASSLQEWGVLSGVEEVAKLLENIPVDVYAMPEGTIFYEHEPVLYIEGKYLDFARYETSILGFLCHASGIATKAARVKLAAGDVPVISFGSRRQHPALAAVIERSAYLGGMDGISNVIGGKMIGLEPSGTMPHALIICFGDQIKAWKAFDQVLSKDIPRVCLCDTYYDEKTEAIMASEALKNKLKAVRLDTPSSRKGKIRKIVEEVRWELDIRGYNKVGIFLSGGMDEPQISELKDIVNGFGVGSSVAAAKPIDFALDIVEREGVPCAKRGKYGGKKQVYRNWTTLKGKMELESNQPPPDMDPLLKPILIQGKIVYSQTLEEARERVLKQLFILYNIEG